MSTMTQNKTKRMLTFAAAALLSASAVTTTAVANPDKATTLDQLLEQVRKGSSYDAKVDRQREAQFRKDKAKQAQLLAQAKRTKAQEEAKSVRLEKEHTANKQVIATKRAAKDKALGVLKELFGNVQAVSGDLTVVVDSSIVSAQYPGRTEFLDDLIKKMSSDTSLPTIKEIEGVWELLHQEMTETGKVAKFNATVVRPDGSHEERDVIRIGTFNLVSDGEYLNFDGNKNTIDVLPRQPDSRYTNSASELQAASDGFTKVGIDPTGPTGGTLLNALIYLPNLQERVAQGREVGYVIVGVGIFALIIAIWRLIALSAVSAKVRSQMKNPDQPKDNNPLGRVLMVGQENKGLNSESLELKLHEAVLKEIPGIEKWVNFIKIVSMVAPLLGLLGTVTGMILTFQALTIFGTGDPKAMAGGISSALVTTVLGLCVAIPTVFLHALVSGRSKKVSHVLEEQVAGIIAEQH